MKKLTLVLTVALLGVACSKSGNTAARNDGTMYGKQATVATAKDARYQIIDQEFDNMLAPQADYEALSDYELQACGATYLPPADPKLKKTAKAARTMDVSAAADVNVNKNKKVTNTTNIYYVDGPNPNVPVQSTTTTTTTSYSSTGAATTSTTTTQN